MSENKENGEIEFTQLDEYIIKNGKPPKKEIPDKHEHLTEFITYLLERYQERRGD